MIILVFCAAQVSAQKRAVFQDSFEDNRNEWFTGVTDNENVEASIHGGAYHVEMKTDSGWQYLNRSVVLDNSKNFIVRMNVRQLSGSLDNEFGLIYNGSDVDNFYEFIITSEKNARLQRWSDGTKRILQEEVQVPAINPQGEWNVLEVRKINDAFSMFVNDAFVGGYTASYLLVFGDDLGLMMRWSQTLEIDELSVVEWEQEAPLVAQGADASAKPVNLGRNVNANSDELVDCIAPDGSLLVFSRADDPENIGDPSKRDVWFSERNSDGSWAKATNPGPPLNTATHNFGVAVTQDLNTLFMQGVYYKDGRSSTSGGVSYSNRIKGGWSKPVVMPIENYRNDGNVINSHISPDGQILVLSIQTPDTYGANDLYVSFRTEANAWTEPRNLGATINSQGMEMGPFIAADGKTLYFASNGHPGYEGRDIFVTVRKDDTWLNWSVPKNLGKPINTDEHDAFFQVTARGDSGYYSSTKEAIGQTDIFSIGLPIGARPEAVVVTYGRVLDAETREPLGAVVVYEKLPGGERVGTANSDPSTGKFRVVLVKGQRYGVHAESEGYYPLSETFDARGITEYASIERDLLLSPIKKNVAIRLNNVFFDVGKYDLRPESFPELDRLSELLTKREEIRIELGGHTDNVGSSDDNKKLSQDRVNSVMAYVLSKGVNKNRLTANGYGESAPVDTNNTEEGRQKNRRVEFTILDN